MTHICAVVGHKGGIGRSSLCQNLGHELAQLGHDTLLIDTDAQANLSMGWGLDPDEERPTIYTAMLDPTRSADCIVNLRPHLDIIPANLDLAGAERQFGADFDRNHKIKNVTDAIRTRYAWILIDCPPTLGFYTANALVAATHAYVPMQCQVYAFRMLGPMIDLIEQAKKANPHLRLSAIIPTMYDARTSLSEPVLEAAREQHGELVTETVIPVNVRIADAPMHGIPVAEHDPRSRGALSYKQLAEELINRG